MEILRTEVSVGDVPERLKKGLTWVEGLARTSGLVVSGGLIMEIVTGRRRVACDQGGEWCLPGGRTGGEAEESRNCS